MEHNKIEDNIKKIASNKKEVIDLLNLLFVSKERERDNPIFKAVYFDRYFSLSLLPNEISTKDFDDAFSEPQKIGERLTSLNQKNSPVLAQKLYLKFKNLSIASTEDFRSMIEGLFVFCQSILVSKSQIDLIEGININNLRNLIADCYKKSIIINEEKRVIFHEILTKERTNYVSISTLLSPDMAFLLGATIAERKNLFNKYRDLQLFFLNETIKKNVLSDFVKIVQQTHLFMTVSDDSKNYTPKDVEWFVDNVLKVNKGYISENLDRIFDYIKKAVTSDEPIGEDIELGKEMIKSIFHDIIYVEKIFNQNSDNSNAEKIINYYNKNEIVEFDFIFTQQAPPNPNFLDYNDHFYPNNSNPKIFDLKKIDTIEIILNPINTNSWRFGFRFGKSIPFPVIQDNILPRHVPDYPYLHLSKGNLIDQKWDDETKLHLSNYILNRPYLIQDPYNNEEIKLVFKCDQDNYQLLVKTRGVSTSFLLKEFDDYRYLDISAWCDFGIFKIAANIKIKNKTTKN